MGGGGQLPSLAFGRDSKARKLNNGVWVGGVDGVGLSSD